MTDARIPLSRPSSRWGLLVLLLPGWAFVATAARVIRAPESAAIGDWAVMLATALIVLAICLGATADTVFATDYDADYLYLFRKSGVKSVPLASIYKLREDKNGGWNIHYHNEQARPEVLNIDPITSGLFNARDTSSIYGFIEAIWPHNPQLDVHYNWWLRL